LAAAFLFVSHILLSSDVPSMNIQVALQNSDDRQCSTWGDRLEGNTDTMQVGHTVVLENDVVCSDGGKKNQHAGSSLDS
jgi:hypothetical protein